jgi:hypothetical protein
LAVIETSDRLKMEAPLSIADSLEEADCHENDRTGRHFGR